MKMRLSFLALAMPAAAGLVMAASTASNAAGLTPGSSFDIAGNVKYTASYLDFTTPVFSPVSSLGTAGDFIAANGTSDLSLLSGLFGKIKDLGSLVGPSPFVENDANEIVSLNVQKFISFTGSPVDLRLTSLQRIIQGGQISFFLDGYIRTNGGIPGVTGNSNLDVSASLVTGGSGFGCAAGQAQECSTAEAQAFLASIDPTQGGAERSTIYAGTIEVGAGRKIPEPMTILGSGLAMASVAALKRKKKSSAVALEPAES